MKTTVHYPTEFTTNSLLIQMTTFLSDSIYKLDYRYSYNYNLQFVQLNWRFFKIVTQ